MKILNRSYRISYAFEYRKHACIENYYLELTSFNKISIIQVYLATITPENSRSDL